MAPLILLTPLLEEVQGKLLLQSGKTGLNPVFIYPEFVVKIVRTVVVRFQAIKIMPFSFNIYGEKAIGRNIYSGLS
ncbi:hypothetical protein MASR1M46_10750 [Bacteroidales bacterium]